MGLGSPLLLLLASATSQWALVGCKSVVSAPLRNAPLGCLARVLGLPRSHSATRLERCDQASFRKTRDAAARLANRGILPLERSSQVIRNCLGTHLYGPSGTCSAAAR